MVKILISGDIGTKENWSQLATRLSELQQSAHGPFHILFLAGQISTSPTEDILQALSSIEIKIYALYCPTLTAEEVTAYNTVVETLPMQRKGIVSSHSNLTVAYFRDSIMGNGNGREDEEVTSIVSSVGYRGCDCLLTSSWPADLYQFLDTPELQTYQQLGLPMGGSREVSDFAMLVKPRYHFSSANVFFQRTPYANVSAANNKYGSILPQPPATNSLFTRFISLAKVSSTKEKEAKWLHALSLQPIIVMKAAELYDTPPTYTDCPYVHTGVSVKRPQFYDPQNEEGPANKRFKAAIQESEAVSGTDGRFFFGAKGQQGGSQHNYTQGKPLNMVPPHAQATTLFVGGLSPDSNERDLHKFMKHIRSIRRVPGKRFAFVDFMHHDAAMYVMDRSLHRPYSCDGHTLIVGWANGADNNNGSSGNNNNVVEKTEEEKFAQAMSERQLVPPSDDARVLYIGNLPLQFDTETTNSNSKNVDGTTTDYDHDNNNNNNSSSSGSGSSSNVSGEAALIAALSTDPLHFAGIEQVHLQRSSSNSSSSSNKTFSFAFVSFVDYAHAMAVLTRSLNERLSLGQRPLIIGWAKHATLHPHSHSHSINNNNSSSSGNGGFNKVLLAEAPHPDCTVLYLGRLPADLTATALEDWLAAYQPLRSVRKAQGRDYAFVDFSDAGTAQQALSDIAEGRLILTVSINSETDTTTTTNTTNANSANTAADTTNTIAATINDTHNADSNNTNNAEDKSGQNNSGSDKTGTVDATNTEDNTTEDNADTPHTSAHHQTTTTVVTAVPVTVGWAKGRAADKDNTSVHCWFCLASPTLKTHLLVSIGEHGYVALPRGGLHASHVLLCPIDCVPSRLHLSSPAKQEVVFQYLRAVEKWFAQQGWVMVTFERSIRTKNSRDHMQIHCIPLEHDLLPQIESVFQQKIAEHHYTFHDVPATMAVEDFVLTAEGGPYQEYFYMELPYEVKDPVTGEGTGAVKRRKKIYLHDQQANSRFLMSLGSEIVAHMMNQPERAFWKNCLLSEEEETENAERVRTSFAAFDPTL